METPAIADTPRPLHTVEQFAVRWPAWSQPALRYLIHNAEDRINSRGGVLPGNGLAEFRAIVRVGRRVLLDEQAFFRWVAAQQRRGGGRAA
jgi:hypothetical protein